MALDKSILNQKLRSAYTDAWNTFIAVLTNNATSTNPVEKPQPIAIQQASITFANQIADAIDDYIKSAEIIIPAGIDVAVTATSVVSGDGASSDTPPAAGSASTTTSTATLTASEVADQINEASYIGKSTANSPKATIS
jgi:hypothetical protein